jgi:hypothetical protein
MEECDLKVTVPVVSCDHQLFIQTKAKGHVARIGTNVDDVMLSLFPPLPGYKDFGAPF